MAEQISEMATVPLSYKELALLRQSLCHRFQGGVTVEEAEQLVDMNKRLRAAQVSLEDERLF